MEHENIEGNVIPADKAKIKNIWKVTAILGAITLLEFIIALGFPGAGGHFKTATFIIMTLVKAAYIVSEFMHLGHEAKALIYTILLPCIFVLWLILALLIQGTAIFEALGF
ncbi:MAG: cytochrome C oxidase subunit IV family protein [Cyclobacteriaceae bacterium]|jgi:cytochrome c oxidase subunit IV|nr:cytochrome C oxidase subunit IV family protein [Cyclobacteriaceae bacterium]